MINYQSLSHKFTILFLSIHNVAYNNCDKMCVKVFGRSIIDNYKKVLIRVEILADFITQ